MACLPLTSKCFSISAINGACVTVIFIFCFGVSTTGPSHRVTEGGGLPGGGRTPPLLSPTENLVSIHEDASLCVLCVILVEKKKGRREFEAWPGSG